MTTRFALAVLAAAALAACDNPSDGSGPPEAAAALSGNTQTGTIGLVLRDTLVLRVTDAEGDPVLNVPVTWQAAAWSGTVTPIDMVTDGDGRVRAVWRLGAGPGPQTATATVAGLAPFTFTAQASAQGLVLVKTGGDAQRDTMGQTLPVPLELTLRTAAGEPVPGIPIAWHNGGHGAPVPTSPVTDAQGRARATWTLAPIPGPAGAPVNVVGVQALNDVFTAYALVGSTPVRLAQWSGSDPAPLGDPGGVVTVNAVATLDNGMPVPDQVVTWRVFSGGGTLVSSTPTDHRGVSTATWRLGTGAAADSIEATLAGGARVVFGARRRPVFTIDVSSFFPGPDVVAVRAIIQPFPQSVTARLGNVTTTMQWNGSFRPPLWTGVFDVSGFAPGTYTAVVTAVREDGLVGMDSAQVQIP